MIHPTAIVHSGATLARDVEIGPYAVIGEHVEIGSGTSVGSHAVVTGRTRIGEGNRLFHHCVLGEVPQDKKYSGEPTRLEIGDHNVIREFCTFNIGTVQDVGVTRVGDHNWIMAYVHLAHDSQVGSHTVLANMVTLAGHVTIHDHVVLGGGTMVHQFCRVGAHAMVGGYTVLTRDVMPYSLTVTEREPRVFGANKLGLERRGFPAEVIQSLHKAFRLLANSALNTTQALERIEAEIEPFEEIVELVRFIRSTERGVIK